MISDSSNNIVSSSDSNLPGPPESASPAHPPPLPTSKLLFSNLKGTLKSQVKFLPFGDYDIASYIGHRGISCAERQRELDLFRFHTPTESERTEVHLPSGRINLHSTKEVFFLCGGLVGVRFESSELQHVTRLCADMTSRWNKLSNIFETFHLSLKKFKIPAEMDENCPNTIQVMEYHKLGDEYLELVVQLQTLVKEKQKQIDKSAVYDHALLRGTDPEDAGHPFPSWYTILKAKYDKEVGGGDKSVGKKGPSMTLGKFAVFLGCHALDPQSWTEKEKEALDELIDASKDFTSIFGSNPSPHHNPHPHAQPPHPHPADKAACAYYARRYFNFLKSVPELKSCVWDEEAVNEMKFA
eukprot:gene27786-33560_t